MLAAAGDRFGDHCLGVPVTGGRSWRRRSCSRRGALEVMVSPRQPRLARSSTAHTSDKHELSPGEPANDLHPAAGLTEGAFDEAGAPDAPARGRAGIRLALGAIAEKRRRWPARGRTASE